MRRQLLLHQFNRWRGLAFSLLLAMCVCFGLKPGLARPLSLPNLTAKLKQASQIAISTISPNPAVSCALVTVNFVVSNLAPGAAPRSGEVTVTDGTNSCTAVLNGSSGGCQLSLPALGAHTLTATYSGNADFNGSTSAPLTVQVTANTPPVLGTYPTTAINITGSPAISPSMPPRDDGVIVSLTATLIDNAELAAPLSINPTSGVIFMSPVYQLGSFSIRVTATDDCGATTTTTFTINVVCPTINILPPLLSNAYKGSAYEDLLRAENAVYPVKFTLANGALPLGLTLREDGLLTGTPTENGTFTFTVKATDAAGCVALRAYTLDQSCKALTLNPPNLIDWREGQLYGQFFEGRGGLRPYTFALQSGTLPPGLGLSTESLGYLTGTPTQLGSFTFTLKVTDANGCVVTRTYTIKIECGTVSLTPTTLREPVAGTAYSQQLTASGSTAPYTFSLTSGTLPPGLSLTSAGLLAGTPTQGGTYAFMIKAVAANGCEGTQRYVVGCPTITVHPTGGNVPIAGKFTASGGVAPYTFSLLGMLPYGMFFSSDGQLGGFPMSGGFFSFTIKATDANGCSGTNNYVLDLTLRPGISNLIPSAVVAGRSAFTLTINGSNFLNNATLSWGGLERPTIVVSSTQLRAEISAADVAQAKSILLTVNNPPPFGSPSHLFPYTIYPSTTRFEADTWPRRDGDGAVDAADVQQMARFVLKLDQPPVGAEFQRADCDPSQTRGDGRLTLADVVQTLHYANGRGVLAEVGGPATQTQPAENKSEELQMQPGGQLTASGGNFPRGQIGALEVQLNATGNETAVGFTLHYDSARLSFLDAVKADFFREAQVFVNDTQPGKLGLMFLLAAGQKLEGGPTSLLSLRFLPHGGAGTEAVAFTFSDELVARTAVGLDLGSLPQYTLTTNNGTGMVTDAAPAFLSAASFTGGATLAPNSVVTAFGTGLATMNATAASLPLPTNLVDTTVTLTDRTNTQHAAPLFFVSPSQINFLLPAAVAEGAAFVTIRTGAGAMVSGIIRINSVAPGIFAAAANGRGLAAAQFLRVFADGAQRYEPVARFDPMTNQFVAVPFVFAPAGEEVFLVLYGTGLRGRSTLSAVNATVGSVPAEVTYVGNQGGLAGLDQVNLRLLRTLVGQGEVDVVLSIDGRTANPVRVNFK